MEITSMPAKAHDEIPAIHQKSEKFTGSQDL